MLSFFSGLLVACAVCVSALEKSPRFGTFYTLRGGGEAVWAPDPRPDEVASELLDQFLNPPQHEEVVVGTMVETVEDADEPPAPAKEEEAEPEEAKEAVVEEDQKEADEPAPEAKVEQPAPEAEVEHVVEASAQPEIELRGGADVSHGDEAAAATADEPVTTQETAEPVAAAEPVAGPELELRGGADVSHEETAEPVAAEEAVAAAAPEVVETAAEPVAAAEPAAAAPELAVRGGADVSLEETAEPLAAEEPVAAAEEPVAAAEPVTPEPTVPEEATAVVREEPRVEPVKEESRPELDLRGGADVHLDEDSWVGAPGAKRRRFVGIVDTLSANTFFEN
mmetsp:Transcript_12369/g.37337  ORF Transcript_12369/g.37337 Transcript_12369/m.37337 type:complete len:338 (+) Transcript_12369:123-1136(+)